MINIDPKRPLGVRVPMTVAEELKRIAAARAMSVNQLTEEILRGHIMRLCRGETIDLDEFTAKVEELIAQHTVVVDRLIKGLQDKIMNQFNVLKAVLDSYVQNCYPDKYRDYCRQVNEIVKAFRLH